MQTIENREIHRENILKILSDIEIPEWKIHNIYIYGSRIYGTYNEGSDYDVIVTACGLDEHKEIMVGDYNIHIYTPDVFKDNLYKYVPVNIECLFLPDWAKVQEKDGINGFTIDDNKIRKHFSGYSYGSWLKAKRKIMEGDYYRGAKSIFHSLRILDIGRQIISHKKIVDFSRANKYWNELVELQDNEECRWKFYNKRFIALRISMHQKLMRKPDLKNV